MAIKAAVLIIVTVTAGYEILIALLHQASARRPIPENVSDVYDEASYLRWKDYNTDKNRLAVFRILAVWAADMLLLASDAYALFAGLFPEGVWPRMCAVLLLSFLSGAVTLPFEYHATMKIEEKYGFNRTDRKTFWADQAKNALIGLALLFFVGSILLLLHQALGDALILAFAGVMTASALAIGFLFPFLSRFFNRFTPLEDGELKERLTALLEKNGYSVRAIQVMGASRRSTKSNAYFTGFGKTKTIVLYDTLVEAMTADEICAVFAHEMGHGLHKDTLKNQILSFLQMLILGVLAWLTLRTPEIFTAFGFGEVNYGFALILIMNVEYALLSPLLGMAASAFSRRAEYRADATAAAEGCGEDLISALRKLARENLSDLSPHPLLVTLTYSHPTLSQRIRAIRENAGPGAP